MLDSWIEWLEVDQPCPACHGKRLNPEALAVRWNDRSIADFGTMPIELLFGFLSKMLLQGREAAIAKDLVAELNSRLDFLKQVGLGYLTLDRSAPTLSGGEAQRIRLAAQLGSNLRGVCYILDEPTIGLHHRDNQVLLGVLEQLEAKGNTLVVVEHDDDTIRRAHHSSTWSRRRQLAPRQRAGHSDTSFSCRTATRKVLERSAQAPDSAPCRNSRSGFEGPKGKLHTFKRRRAHPPILTVVTAFG